METEIDGRLPYLDLVLINNGENQNITTDFYSKPSSSGRILNFHLSHPRHVVKNTAYNFVSRVLALSSDIFHEKNKAVIFETLQRNSFPERIIKQMIAKYYAIKSGPVSNTSVVETPGRIFKGLTYVLGTSELISKVLKTD